jgi:hypothetical protein
MQDSLFSTPYTCSENFEAADAHSSDDLGLTFNTAFVRSRMPASGRDLSAELTEISKTPAYVAVMNVARQLAQAQKISELEAAEQIISTFRKMDEIWGSYLVQEGMARITSPN